MHRPTTDSPAPSRSRAPRRRGTAPHRRVHRRTHTAAFLLVGVAVWLYVGLVPLHLWRNDIMLYTWFILGAALVPVTILWIMLHRLRTTDSVTAMNLVTAAVIGGALAVVLGGSLDSAVGLIPQTDRMVSLTLAGFVEEFAKGVLIVAVGWRVAKTTRNGLFVGGAVGLGFAVLETVGYIGTQFATTDSIWAAGFVAGYRGLLAPFGHVLWSSLVGAALFSAASRTGRFRLTWTVVGAYVGAAVLHGTWDGAQPVVLQLTGSTVLAGLAAIGGMLLPIAIGVPIWRHIARAHPAPSLASPVPDGVPLLTGEIAVADASPTATAPGATAEDGTPDRVDVLV